MGARNLLPLFYATGDAEARHKRSRRGKALASAPLVSAAIRVPERLLAVTFPGATPQLFVHEGARQALERKLKVAFPGPVVLSITDNRHSMVTHSLRQGVLRVRVHHMFLDAPAAVVDALVRYVTRGERDASAAIGRYIEANHDRLAPRAAHAPLHTKGAHHDLLAIFGELNRKYFRGEVDAVITWGKRPTARSARPRTTIKLGSYTAVERLIRVHPALDQSWVPRYFVAYIVYHEMLHHMIPASRGPGRTLLHPPEFRAEERKFEHFARALAWERRNIGRVLRA